MSATEQKLREASERINVLEAWKRDALASLNDWHGLEALVPREFAHGIDNVIVPGKDGDELYGTAAGLLAWLKEGEA